MELHDQMSVFPGVWTQCLYPPDPPPATRLASTWSGDPVDFYGNVSFVCEEEELYFEWDRDMEEFNITCQLGGTWDEPEEWPICLPSKETLIPVDKHWKSLV